MDPDPAENQQPTARKILKKLKIILRTPNLKHILEDFFRNSKANTLDEKVTEFDDKIQKKIIFRKKLVWFSHQQNRYNSVVTPWNFPDFCHLFSTLENPGDCYS